MRSRISGTVIALVAIAIAACAPRESAPSSDRPSTITASASAIAPSEARSPAASATTTTSPARSSAPTVADEQLVRDIIAFARAPTAATLATVPFADQVGLGLAERITITRPLSELVLPSAWVLLPSAPFRGRDGAWTALGLLRTSGSTIVSLGAHPHCASPPVPSPIGFAGHRRVSVQPMGIDTCVLWWTVDLFVGTSGRIEAVTLDLWEP